MLYPVIDQTPPISFNLSLLPTNSAEEPEKKGKEYLRGHLDNIVIPGCVPISR